MGEVAKIETPRAHQEYEINGEVWIVVQATYNISPGERTLQLTLQPKEEVKMRMRYNL